MKGRYLQQYLLTLALALSIVACGGGGGGDDGGGNNPPPPAGSYSLSGRITSADNIDVDSDLNDPLAPYAANDLTGEAQSLANPVMLNGFISLDGTGVNGDRFGSVADENDFYRVSLYSGQYVSLRVASFDSNSPGTNDVDIRIYDAGLNLVAESQTVTEFESVAVPADGEYYIQVYAYAGISKYVLSIGNASLTSAPTASGWSGDFIIDQALVKRRPQLPGSRASSLLEGLNGVELSHQMTDRHALLRLDPHSPKAETFNALNGGAALRQPGDWQQVLPEATRRKIETLGLIKLLNRQAEVESAAPNFRLHSLLEPNDTHYSYQVHYNQIKLPQAWDITTGTPATGDIIVAVVDTGHAMDHEDFSGQLVNGYDFISDSNTSNDGDGIDNDPHDPGTSTNPGESNFHGTHVAGTIAAASNNNLGVAGVAWGAKIMPLRALGLGGSGSLDDILQAVRYAAGLSNDSNTLPAQAADIINLSLGGSGYTQIAQDTYTEARNAGVIIIAAAGNSNSSNPMYPAAYDGVVSVSAMDFHDAKAPYSNYGSTIDVGAPGGNTQVDDNGDSYSDGVLSCVINDSTGTRVSNYGFYQGTSMASPHMAGVVALMKAVHPNLTPIELDTMLSNGSLTQDLGDPGRDDIYGHGRIDAFKAVEAAQNAAGNPGTNTVVASPTSVDFGATINTATVSLSGVGNTPPSVTSFTSDQTWLSVSATSVDANGLGDYTLTVDRSGMVDAIYTGRVDFVLSDGNTVSVSASMRVQTQPTGSSGSAGFLYLVLFDPGMSNQGQLNLSPVNGRYDFQFSNVPAGDYYLLAGSDVDNDGYICEVGESCGGYPLRYQESLVTVDRDISGLDFNATINSGLGSASLQLPQAGVAVDKLMKSTRIAPR